MLNNENRFSRLMKRPEMLCIVALLLLLVYNLFFTSGFFNIEIKDGHLYGSLIDILRRGAPLYFMAMGMTLVIATGSTDVSVGAIAAISASTAARLIGGEFDYSSGAENLSQTPFPIAILVALGVATLCGVWNGFLVAQLGIQALVATLMLQVAGRGIAQLITDGLIITVYYKPFFVFGSGYLFGLPVSLYIVAAVAFFISTFTRKTSYGLFLESAGSSRSASRYVGLKVKRTIWVAFAISGLMAGIAGILIASEVKSADANNAGLYYELDAILSVVLGGNSMKGGRFSLAGSLIGAVFVQALTTTIYMKGVPSETILVVKALAVVIVGLIQVTDFHAFFGRIKDRFSKKPGLEAGR